MARAEKEDYSNPKKFAESSLFLLKCLERLISDKALISYQLNENLFAYRRGVYFLVFKMKDTVLRDKYAMGMFVNTKGAFNYAPFQKFFDIAREHDTIDASVEWIYAYAGSICR